MKDFRRVRAYVYVYLSFRIYLHSFLSISKQLIDNKSHQNVEDKDIK